MNFYSVKINIFKKPKLKLETIACTELVESGYLNTRCEVLNKELRAYISSKTLCSSLGGAVKVKLESESDFSVQFVIVEETTTSQKEELKIKNDTAEISYFLSEKPKAQLKPVNYITSSVTISTPVKEQPPSKSFQPINYNDDELTLNHYFNSIS